jgi:intein/homing endonuclease
VLLLRFISKCKFIEKKREGVVNHKNINEEKQNKKRMILDILVFLLLFFFYFLFKKKKCLYVVDKKKKKQVSKTVNIFRFFGRCNFKANFIPIFIMYKY